MQSIDLAVIGLFTPPFGLGYYAAYTMGRVDPNAGLRCIWPYLGALSIGLMLVAAVPWLSVRFLGVKSLSIR
nr:TRAP transporter large permease subunit [Paralcaligenes ureilyticus]